MKKVVIVFVVRFVARRFDQTDTNLEHMLRVEQAERVVEQVPVVRFGVPLVNVQRRAVEERVFRNIMKDSFADLKRGIVLKVRVVARRGMPTPDGISQMR